MLIDYGRGRNGPTAMAHSSDQVSPFVFVEYADGIRVFIMTPGGAVPTDGLRYHTKEQAIEHLPRNLGYLEEEREAAEALAQIEMLITGLEIALALTPGGTAMDHLQKGEYEEALKSGLIDALLASLGLGIAKLAKGGKLLGTADEAVESAASGRRVDLNVLQKECFVAGTQVLVGYDDDGRPVTKAIEELAEGDYVLARDQHDAGDDVNARRVVRVFSKASDHLRVVSYRDASGNKETLQTTDEHAFGVAGLGWMSAADLRPGMRLGDADGPGGVELTVISSVREEHPEGIAVYNFEVEGDHTYFVEDGHGTQLWAWVHNDCSADAQALRAAFEAAGKKASQGDQAAHLVPGRISSSNPIVQTALDNMRDVLSRLGIGHNSKWNGMFAPRGHYGTHRHAYFIDAAERLLRAEADGGLFGVLKELRRLAKDAKGGAW